MLKKLLKISFLGLFLFYYSGSVLFYHSHVIDGVVIVHSHPFPLSKTHAHTATELTTIQILSHTVFLLSLGFFSFFAFLRLLAVSDKAVQEQYYCNKTLLVRSLRAPPTLLFSHL